MNNNNNRDIQELITEVEAENNGTYRETLIGTFINEGRRSGLLESLLLVGSNMIINDLSSNYYTTNYYDTENDSLLRQTIRNSFYDKPKYKNVLSEEGVEKLKDTKYNPEIHLNQSCPIFQTDFSVSDDVTELPCKHVFTPTGIRKWLKEENAICPVCRYKFSSKEIPSSEIQNTESSLYRTLDISTNLINSEILSEPFDLSVNTPNINYNSINMFNRLLYFIDMREQQILEEEELQQTIINSMDSH